MLLLLVTIDGRGAGIASTKWTKAPVIGEVFSFIIIFNQL